MSKWNAWGGVAVKVYIFVEKRVIFFLRGVEKGWYSDGGSGTVHGLSDNAPREKGEQR
jgi:hypothetical protein